MTRNPLYNALLALGYIVGFVTLAQFVPAVFASEKDNIFMPMVALSALVLSVATMAYLFFYQPALLLLDGKRQEAAKLFLQTIAIFACGTLVIFSIAAFASRMSA